MAVADFLQRSIHELRVVPIFMFLSSVLSRAMLFIVSFLCYLLKFTLSAAWSLQMRLIDWTLQNEINPLTITTFKDGKPVITTMDPEFAKRVLNMKRSPSRRPICQRLKLIEEDPADYFTDGEWLMGFTIMGKTFKDNNRQQFVNKIAVITERYICALNEHVKDRQQDWHLYRFLKFFSIDSMMYATYGMDSRIIDDPQRPFLAHFENLETPDSSWFWKKLREFFEKRPPAAAALDELGGDVMDCMQVRCDSDPESVGCSFMGTFLKRPDFPKRGDDQMATSFAMLLVLAGAENIAFTLYTCLYLLARNPVKQAKMREEVVRVLGDRKKVEPEDLLELQYVEGVIRETLRLFPLDASLKRIADKTGSICGIPVDEGTPIEIKLREMNLYHENFPDPWNFKPERFCEPAVLCQQNLDALLTFGSGRGACLAADFAMDVMKSFIASFFLSFDAKKTSKTPIIFYLPADKIASDHFVKKNKFEFEPLYIGLSRLDGDGIAR